MTLKKVGGIWFAKLWRLNVSLSMSKRSVVSRVAKPKARPYELSLAYRRHLEREANLAMARRMAMS